MPLTEKQKKIAVVAEPRDEITGADFEALRNSKMGGGMIKYSEGGETRREMLAQLREDALEKGDEDAIIEIDAELFQMGDGEAKTFREGGRVKNFRNGMSVNTSKGRGCGAAVKGRSYSGTY